MTFEETSPDLNFPLYRAVDSTNKVEFGIMPVIFGKRVRVGLVGDFGPTVDLCAGANQTSLRILLEATTKILERIPDHLANREVIRDSFPEWIIRPLFLDVIFWNKLAERMEDKEFSLYMKETGVILRQLESKNYGIH